jgi:non-ribosomal peptide synthase protein (TIGR01720 family)
VGRADQQVKLRGYRVELEEIAGVLLAHERVQAAVVEVRSEASGQKRLVAYVVPGEPAGEGQEPGALRAELQAFLAARLPEYMVPHAWVLLEALPLTPNGKIDRRALPAPAAQEARAEEASDQPQTRAEALLAQIWAEVLGLERVGIHANFFEVGGDSILSIQIVDRAGKLGLSISPKQIFEHPTIARLAAVSKFSQAAQPAQQEPLTGEVPLTPIQHWFFEQPLAVRQHWNQGLLLELHQPLTAEQGQALVMALLAQHDALRLRYRHGPHGWQQAYAELQPPVPFEWLDLSELPEQERAPALAQIADQQQASLNLERGPLFRVAYITCGEQTPARLLLVAHHLVVDAVSWRVLLSDLQQSLDYLRRGAAISPLPKTTSFQAWSRQLTDLAQSAELRDQHRYWLNLPWQHVSPIPCDYQSDRRRNQVATTALVATSLPADETRALLHEVPRAYHTQINDVLLAAAGLTFADWTGRPTTLIDLEGHGREDLFEHVDVSRTVGWFTTLFPVVLELAASTAPSQALTYVKEYLRGIPQRGIGYGLLRYLSADAGLQQRLQELPQAEISFNYLGQLDQSLPRKGELALAPESAGTLHHPSNQRRYLIEISGSIVNEQLHLNWIYSSAFHSGATIEYLAQQYLARLRVLIEHCLNPQAGGYTPSDFRSARLTQNELDTLMTKLGKGRRR